MPRSPIPDALVMRELKFGAAPAAQRDQVAALLLAAGRRTEALLLFEGRGGHPALVQARDHAVMHGLAFPLLALQRLGAPVAPEHLRAAAGAAERGGRWMDARQMYRAVDDQDAVRRIAAHLPASLVPPAPPAATPATPGA